MTNIEKARKAAADMLDAEGRQGLAGVIRAGQADDQDSVKAFLTAFEMFSDEPPATGG